jgi:predicted nucleic-acid-binding Zn-ribbon protein
MSSGEREAELMRCPECGGACVVTVLQGVRGGPKLKRAEDWMPFDVGGSGMWGRTCVTCGYTRLYAARPENLR